MNSTRRIRVLVGSLVAVVLLGWTLFLDAKIHLYFAHGQLNVFEDLWDEAKANPTPERRKEILRALRDFYPSGTMQRKGSTIDLLVETARKAIETNMVLSAVGKGTSDLKNEEKKDSSLP